MPRYVKNGFWMVLVPGAVAYPSRQARKIDGRRQRRLQHWHGTALGVGLPDDILPPVAGRSGPAQGPGIALP